MHLITGISDEFFIFTGRILSQMKRFSLALDNHSCLTLSVDVACLSSDISVVPIPVKTIPELFSRAFWVLPETGIAELVDRDILAEDSGGRSTTSQFRPGDSKAARLDRWAWRLPVWELAQKNWGLAVEVFKSVYMWKML